jgi:gamma-glutamylaminecyclotransferase
MGMPALLFVYGTLKEGFPNHALNTGRRVGGVYRTRLPFPFYVVRLANEDRAPWLVNSPGEGRRVAGQVFEVDSAALQAMDAFEEVGLASGYVRVEVELEVANAANTLLRAHAYMKQAHQLAACLAREGPFDEYTPELAIGYRLVEAPPATSPLSWAPPPVGAR